MIIYKTTNLINNKIYIGKDCKNNPNYLGSGSILKKAILKYGRNSFIKEILEDNILDTYTLEQREIYWIQYYNSTSKDIGYNITTGGTGGDTLSNHPNLNNIRKKLSIASKSIWNSDINGTRREFYSKLFKGKSNPMYGKTHTSASRKKIGNRTYLSGEHNFNYGKKTTAAVKLKLSNSLKNKPSYWKGKTIPNSARYKMSKSVNQYMIDGLFIKYWDSISDAKREVGATKISAVCKKKCKSSCGYLWDYSSGSDQMASVEPQGLIKLVKHTRRRIISWRIWR